MTSEAVRKMDPAGPKTGRISSVNSGEVPDVRALMADIRDRIKKDLAASRDAMPAFVSHAPTDAQSARKAGELLHSEDLQYLNSNYSFARLNLESIASHRPGFLGKLIVRGKRKLMQLIWDSILRDYFTAERDFHAHLVRYLNDVSKYVDARDASNFWELIRKIDVDITRALERIETFADEQGATLRSTERRLIDSFDTSLREISRSVGELKGQGLQHADQLRVLDSVARGIEGVVARLKVTTGETLPGAAGAERAVPQGDYSYLMLENRFRGSEADIAARLADYVPVFRGSTAPVLEIGGGRGELQQLFREAQIPSYCVDLDAAMVESAVQKGLDARLGDGIAHLRSLADHSIGGVIAIQVVEHLTRSQLEELFALCNRKVIAGGRVVFETINPQSMLALSSNYFRDPTHVFPMHPDTLRYMLELSGFVRVAVQYRSPVAPEAQLRMIETSEHMPPRWAYAVELMNRNFDALNRIIYGHQDFCIIGEVK